jgi:integrase
MFFMVVPLDAVADQLGHASIGVTKGVYAYLLPGSRAKAAKAMEELLYKDFAPSRHRVRIPWLDIV